MFVRKFYGLFLVCICFCVFSFQAGFSAYFFVMLSKGLYPSTLFGLFDYATDEQLACTQVSPRDCRFVTDVEADNIRASGNPDILVFVRNWRSYFSGILRTTIVSHC